MSTRDAELEFEVNDTYWLDDLDSELDALISDEWAYDNEDWDDEDWDIDNEEILPYEDEYEDDFRDWEIDFEDDEV